MEKCMDLSLITVVNMEVANVTVQMASYKMKLLLLEEELNNLT